jgi:hypothetical protein
LGQARQIFQNGQRLEKFLTEFSDAYETSGLNSSLQGAHDGDIDNLLLAASNAVAHWCNENQEEPSAYAEAIFQG